MTFCGKRFYLIINIRELDGLNTVIYRKRKYRNISFFQATMHTQSNNNFKR